MLGVLPPLSHVLMLRQLMIYNIEKHGLSHLYVLGVYYISAICQLPLGDSVALHNTRHGYVFSFVLCFNI